MAKAVSKTNPPFVAGFLLRKQKSSMLNGIRDWLGFAMAVFGLFLQIWMLPVPTTHKRDWASTLHLKFGGIELKIERRYTDTKS